MEICGKNGQIKLFGQSFLYKGKAFSVNSGKIGQQIIGDLEKGRVVDVVRKGESSEYFFKYYGAGVQSHLIPIQLSGCI